MADGLIIPAIILAVAAFAVPRLWALLLAEGVSALVINGVLSTVSMFATSAAIFFGLYVSQGAAASALVGEGFIANLIFFGRLGLSAALIWAPVLILSLSGLPRKWVHATW